MKWRTVDYEHYPWDIFCVRKSVFASSPVSALLLKLTNRDYWNLSPGHFPYSISLFSYDRWYTLTNYKVSKKDSIFWERGKFPPISSIVLTWKLGSFSALSDCKSPTLRVADHFVNCCCAASSAFRNFSFYSVRCGFLDEFDFSCFRVFLCLQIDYYFAYSVKIN